MIPFFLNVCNVSSFSGVYISSKPEAKKAISMVLLRIFVFIVSHIIIKTFHMLIACFCATLCSPSESTGTSNYVPGPITKNQYLLNLVTNRGPPEAVMFAPFSHKDCFT